MYMYTYSYFEKVCWKEMHATIPNSIVDSFECTVPQSNLKECFSFYIIHLFVGFHSLSAHLIVIGYNMGLLCVLWFIWLLTLIQTIGDIVAWMLLENSKRKENDPSQARLACHSRWRACLRYEGCSIFLLRAFDQNKFLHEFFLFMNFN